VVVESDVEEGLADVITAYTNGNDKIGFVSRDDPGPLGFRLSDGRANAWVTELRAAVGKAFFDFYSKLTTAQRDRGLALFYRWLGTHRAANPRDQTLDDVSCFLEELVITNEEMNLEDEGKPDRPLIPESLLLDAFADDRFRKSTPFLRGDTDGNGRLSLTDPVRTLNYLFRGLSLRDDCRDAMDANDDGDLNISDAVLVLSHLFLPDSPGIAEPFPRCGFDSPAPDPYCCLQYNACPP
jgi:hypothetical protein